MTRRLFPGWALAMVGILALLPNVARSDIYLKQKEHTAAMTVMGQTKPAQDVVSETWITPQRMATSNERQTIVVDPGANSITIVDHENKTMMTLPLDFTGKQGGVDMGAGGEPDMQEFMNQMMSVQISVQPTNETKKINRWQCKKYIQVIETGMGTIKSEVWATTDIHVDEDLYTKYNAAIMAQMPGFARSLQQAMKELKKIKGVHVLVKQSFDMMGQSIDSTSELLDFREGKAPAAVFQLPDGYKKQEMPFLNH